MAMEAFDAAETRISGIVQGILAKHEIYADIETGADLRNIGLTSLDMVNLMLAVEDEFEIEIPQSAMTPENFSSVAAIERLLHIPAIAA